MQDETAVTKLLHIWYRLPGKNIIKAGLVIFYPAIAVPSVANSFISDSR